MNNNTRKKLLLKTIAELKKNDLVLHLSFYYKQLSEVRKEIKKEKLRISTQNPLGYI